MMKLLEVWDLDISSVRINDLDSVFIDYYFFMGDL